VQTEGAKPFVVTIIPQKPAAETTLSDVLVGSLGLTGALILLALVLGVVVAVLRFGWNRLHPAEDDHLPPVSPLIKRGDDDRSSAVP
jgi:hypothetical protein